MIDFLISYWWLIVVAIAAFTVIGYAIYQFFKKPSSEQLNEVKEWLLYAVMKAEKELGSGTGAIKLRYVYDMFVTKFSWLAMIIPFNTFSTFVDEALEKFENLLKESMQLQEYVIGTSSKEEVK